MFPKLLRTAASLLVCVALFGARPASAKDPIEVWSEAAIRYEPVKDLDLTLGYSVRFGDRMSHVERYFPEASVRYEVLDWLRLGAGYRFVRDRRASTGEYQNMHRYHFDASSSVDVFDDFELGFRARIQRTHSRTANKGLLELLPELRTRFSVEYERHDIVRPEVSWELYMPWGDETHSGKFHAHEWRLKVSLCFRLDDHDLTPFYMFEQTLDERPTERTHILGLEYMYEF